MKAENFVRVILACVSGGQFVVALLCLFSGEGGLAKAKQIYGARFSDSPQFSYILRPLGVYLLAMSLIQFAAVRHPRRYKRVVDFTIALFALRQFQRFFFRERITSTFGIAPERHLKSSLFFAFWGLALLLSRIAMGRDHSAHDA